jgi:hypothetical protein
MLIYLQGNWMQNMRNRRKIFDEFAKQVGFDPLVEANWYGKSKHMLISEKNSTVHKVEEEDERGWMRGWEVREGGEDERGWERMRKDEKEREHGFDPLVEASWNGKSKHMLISEKILL